MTKIKFFVVVISLVFSVSSLAPQEPGQEPAHRLRIRENVHRLRLLRMTEALELSEDQTAKIYPAATQIEREKAALARKIGQEIQDLRIMLRTEAPDEQALAKKVRSIRDLRKAIQEKDQEFEAMLEENLTEVQKARYVLFTLDFYRGLGEKLDRARQTLREKRKY
jgi:Spy/CpxP family protein refolding chaperone